VFGKLRLENGREMSMLDEVQRVEEIGGETWKVNGHKIRAYR